MQFFGTTKINFLGKWKICTVISIIIITTGILSLITKGGPAYNIDFAGGSLVQVRYANPVSISEVRAEMKTIGYGDAIIQEFGSPNDILIRVSEQKEAGTEEESISDKIIRGLKTEEELEAIKAGKLDLNNSDEEKIKDYLSKLFPSDEDAKDFDSSLLSSNIVEKRDGQGGIFKNLSEVTSIPGFTEEVAKKVQDKIFLGKFIMERVEMVGPKVGKDLRSKALFAIYCAIIALLIYITFRFEFVFAVGAVIALVHDVLITLGIFSLFNKEISLVVIAAFLTIAGYSVNDTIVVFDRAKENFTKSKSKLNILDFDTNTCFDILNMSVNQTLSRTILTVCTTLLTVLTLFIFGGAVIHDFSFALLIGIVTGTYSSVYIASSLVYGINYIGRKKKGYIDSPRELKKPVSRPRIKKSKVSEAPLTNEKTLKESVEKAQVNSPELNNGAIRKKTRGKSRAKQRDKAKSKKKK